MPTTERELRRVRAGRGFAYRRADGSVERDAGELARIRALAIPPAWTDVRVASDPDRAIQATGRDAKGRKQYRYHPAWRARREAQKFGRLGEFGMALPDLRRRRDAQLHDPNLTGDTVTALAVWLLERTLIRVGGEEYVRSNGSFGLTTLRREHVRRQGPAMVLRFVGKSGVEHRVRVEDPLVVARIAECRRLPGEHLFQYVDGSSVRVLHAADVNDYLRDVTGTAGTAKDFRTWLATVRAGAGLAALVPASSLSRRRRQANEVVDVVAAQLHNTRAVCRASYIHPGVVTSFLDTELADLWTPDAVPRSRRLDEDERSLLGFLGRRTSRSGRRAA